MVFSISTISVVADGHQKSSGISYNATLLDGCE